MKFLKRIRTVATFILLIAVSVCVTSLGKEAVSKALTRFESPTAPIAVAATTSFAQKRGSNSKLITSADLDHADVSGAQIFYQLLPEEGGQAYQLSNGTYATKVPAQIIFDYHGRRNARGQLVFAIRVDRPGFLGGGFTKDEVAFDSSRSPGTIDEIQPGDLFH